MMRDLGGVSLPWEKYGKEITSLAPDAGSGVIHDPVFEKLADHDIIIEAVNWRKWPLSNVVYSKRITIGRKLIRRDNTHKVKSNGIE